MTRTVRADRARPWGTTEVQASRLCTRLSSRARIKTSRLPMSTGPDGAGPDDMAVGHEGRDTPAIAASTPHARPAASSQAEKSAQMMLAVCA